MSETFGAQLSRISAQRQGVPSDELTANEVQELHLKAKANATKAAMAGKKSASIRFDLFKRLGLLASVKVPVKPNQAFEDTFKGMDINLTFSSNLSCGMCNMRDCLSGAHYGYTLSWK